MFKLKNKNKYITLIKPQKRKKKGKHIKNKKNYILFFILSIFIAFIFIFFIKRLLFSRTYEQITNDVNDIINKVHYHKGKIYWDNKKSINKTEIEEEIKDFNEIKISFEKQEDFIKRNYPKVSIVITVHNQEKYIKLIYSSIQKQELKDIEIIFVDDASNDDSSLIIKDLMKKDKRIVYLKNNINKRALYSRNRGILNAKGEYITVIDSDDLLINNILIKAYGVAKKFNLDMVQYYLMGGVFPNASLIKLFKYKDGIIKGNSNVKHNFARSGSRNLWDKLIRRETYIKSIKFMKEEFKKQIYFVNNDDTSSFGLIHVVESYGFLDDVGYYYVSKPRGVYYYRNDPKNANLIFQSVFNNMKYFYYQSEDNASDKFFALDYFKKKKGDLYGIIKYLTKDFDFILEIIDLYLNSVYFSDHQKIKLNEFKSKIIQRKNEMNQEKNNK